MVEGAGYCPPHKRTISRNASRRRRAINGSQHYDTAAWQRTRTTYRQQHPHCPCGAPTGAVDHVIPRQILIEAGVTNPDHPQWLQSLCERHHNAKTALVDKPILARLVAGHAPAAELADEALRSVRSWLEGVG